MQNELITGPDLAALLMIQPVDLEKITRKAWLKIERKNPSRYILKDAVQGYLRYLDHERTRGRSVKECADHLVMSTRRFLQLVTEGVFERAPPAGYDIDDVRERFIKHQRELAAGREGEGNAMLAANRSRLAAARAEQAEFEGAVRRGEYTHVPSLERVLAERVAITREIILTCAGTVSHACEGRSRVEIETIMMAHLCRALEEIAGAQDDVRKRKEKAA